MTSRTGIKHAFTLVELLLVLVVIAILVGVSVPALNTSVRHAEFNGFVSKLYLFLDYSRSRSTLKNTVLAVNFDSAAKTVYLKEGDEVINRLDLPDGMTIQTKEAQVWFYPDGTSQQFQLLVQSGSGQKSIILSRGFDGKIRIDDYDAQN